MIRVEITPSTIPWLITEHNTGAAFGVNFTTHGARTAANYMLRLIMVYTELESKFSRGGGQLRSE